MLTKIQTYIREEQLFKIEDRLLITCSGGPDSIFLLHSLHSLGYNCTVAHCNFQLRGEESIRDRDFVVNYCQKLGINYKEISFNTQEYAKEHKQSIEMAARELRYNWFETLRKEGHYDSICVGHHLDDSIETFFLNLLRGTGIKGISGIKPKNGHLTRPLLCLKQEEINNYLTDHQIESITDSSNLSTDYTRNKLRHNIIPKLQEIQPNLLDNMRTNLENFNEARLIYNSKIEELKATCFTQEKDEWKIQIDQLLASPFSKTILFEILQDFGFKPKLIKEISTKLQAKPGLIFESENYNLLKDREYLILYKKREEENIRLSITKETQEITYPIQLKLEHLAIMPKKEIKRAAKYAYLDADKLQFPLELSHWKEGDSFHPLGMQQSKKISDFLIDQKVNRKEKTHTYVLRSGANIVWVIGWRIDDHYKIDASTKQVLRITFS